MPTRPITYMEPDGTIKSSPIARCASCGGLVSESEQSVGNGSRSAPGQQTTIIARIGALLSGQRDGEDEFAAACGDACAGF